MLPRMAAFICLALSSPSLFTYSKNELLQIKQLACQIFHHLSPFWRVFWICQGSSSSLEDDCLFNCDSRDFKLRSFKYTWRMSTLLQIRWINSCHLTTNLDKSESACIYTKVGGICSYLYKGWCKVSVVSGVSVLNKACNPHLEAIFIEGKSFYSQFS